MSACESNSIRQEDKESIEYNDTVCDVKSCSQNNPPQRLVASDGKPGGGCLEDRNWDQTAPTWCDRPFRRVDGCAALVVTWATDGGCSCLMRGKHGVGGGERWIIDRRLQEGRDFCDTLILVTLGGHLDDLLSIYG